ncbi:hypothetical protein F5144DRAFT_587269 [Chaetomium tenue]|uniref:Uncharacterized protein n=1 Tax=Chaetomium tenue TaxID=1854479 RepID=A0ACB7NU18_9PEZI|nr:hypothetical protein F5144DRAFT_587269 [Chaetomium globosum]
MHTGVKESTRTWSTPLPRYDRSLLLVLYFSVFLHTLATPSHHWQRVRFPGLTGSRETWPWHAMSSSRNRDVTTHSLVRHILHGSCKPKRDIRVT